MNARPWLKSYPPGVRWNAPLELAPIQSILENSARRFADLPALQFMDKRISYAELDALSDRAAAGFEKLGVGPGVHVGLLLPNLPHYAIAFFGVLKAGGTVVNSSPLDALAALEFKVGDSETDILVTVDVASIYPRAEKLLETTRLKTLIVGDFAEFAAAPGPVRAVMTAQGMLAEVRYDARRIAFRDLIDNDGRFEKHVVADPAETVAVIAYTGGTTGTPKGAMLTHANLTAACSLYREVFTRSEAPLREGGDRMLCVLPLFHIYSLSVVMLLGFRMGAELIVHPRFDPAQAARDIGLKKITAYFGVPTMHVAILGLPDVEKMDFSSLRLCCSGGAPLPLAVKQRWEEVVGCPLSEGWGMTETSPIGTFTPREGPPRPGSCGLPYPCTEMKLVDVADPTREVATGERGEICVRGPNVMKGYWKKPAETAAAMTPDGFFRTGDVATIDADGYVYIVDRTKDMLLCGGFNVYPRAIEEAIYKHPSVEEVSVIGIPDPYRGESPKAFVKLRDGAPALTFDDLKIFLKDRLGKHEMIGALEIRDALPKTAVGKISKKDLREAERAHGG